MSNANKYALYIAEQEKRNIFNQSKVADMKSFKQYFNEEVLTEEEHAPVHNVYLGHKDKEFVSHDGEDEDDGTGENHPHLDKALIKIDKHHESGKYKVNYRNDHGEHHNAMTAQDTHAHEKPDITVHTDHATENSWKYVLHHGGKAYHDKELQVKHPAVKKLVHMGKTVKWTDHD